MWARFIEDFNIIKGNAAFRDFCKKYQGCVLNFFYFPCKKPLGTEYNLYGKERLYMLSQCYNNIQKEEKNLDEVYADLWKVVESEEFQKAVGSRFGFVKQYFFKVSKPEVLLEKIDSESYGEIADCFDYEPTQIISTAGIDNTSLVFHKDKHYFQLNKESYIEEMPDNEYTSYEFVLCDFLDFWKHNKEQLIPVMHGTYRNIICGLFNAYITQWEIPNKKIVNNILPEAIQPMKIGWDHGDSINPVYVPNKMTLGLCQRSELYRNIFKILLINLQIFKKFKFCVYMSRDQVKQFNEISQTINSLKTNYQVG